MIHLFPPRPKGPSGRAGFALDSSRWAALCKAAAAVAVEEGHLSAKEACDLCLMDPHELEVWQHVVQDRGLRRMLAGRL